MYDHATFQGGSPVDSEHVDTKMRLVKCRRPERGQKRCVAGTCQPKSHTEKNMGFGMLTKVDYGYGVLRVNSKLDRFYLSLFSYVDRHAPVKKMNNKDLKLHLKPWIIPKIYDLIKYHDKITCNLDKKFINSIEYLDKKFRLVN